MRNWTEDNTSASFNYKISDDPDSTFSMIQGRTNSYSKIGQLDKATKPVIMVTTIEDILRMYFNF